MASFNWKLFNVVTVLPKRQLYGSLHQHQYIHPPYFPGGRKVFFTTHSTFFVQTLVCFALRLHDQRMGSIQTEAGIHSMSLVSDMH